jgi:trimethylamine--corrinoid protein Co-methyltransferase
VFLQSDIINFQRQGWRPEEILAGLALIQAVSPGCPVLYGASASVMDVMTGALAMGAPERALVMLGVINLAKHYGLPSMPAALNTEASMPGSQAAFEKMVSTMPLVLAGADVIFGGGTFDSANTYSLDQLVIDDEMCGAMLRVARGFQTEDEQLAASVIEKVGIGGQFLGESHTLKHVRSERWFPALYKRTKRAETEWSLETMGKHDLAAAARTRVAEILKTHKPEPLNGEVQRALKNIVSSAERPVLTTSR